MIEDAHEVFSQNDSGLLPVVGMILLAWYLIHLYSMLININDPIPYGAFVPFFGCIFQLLWNPHRYLSTRTVHNGIFNIYVLGKVVTVAVDSRHFHTIFRKLEFYDTLSNFNLDKVLGDYAVPFKAHEFLGLLRRQFLPTVYDAPVILQAPLLREFTRQQKKLGVSNMDKFRLSDIHAFLVPVLLSMNVRLILGEEMANDADFIDGLSDWGKAALDVIRRPSFLGIFARRRCLQIRKKLLHRLQTQMKRAMALPDDADACETEKYAFIMDLLKMTKNDPEWDLDKMSEKLLGLVYGSVANTPIVASNVILHILRDQSDVQSRVQQEVDLAYRIGGGQITPSGIFSMCLTEFCIEESLRLVGLPFHIRQTTRETHLAGTSITLPANRLLIVPLSVIHRSKESFPESPDEFHPDRFRRAQDLNMQRRRSTISSPHSDLLSWGRGTHRCLGRLLAISEIKIVISHLLHNFHVTVENEADGGIQFITSGSSMVNNRAVILKRISRKPPKAGHHRRTSSQAV